jgi:hypothetical protein
MVVMTMTGPAAQINLENGLEPYKSLYFQLLEGSEGNSGPFPVVVKNLTTVGIILEILPPDNGYKTESLKGGAGFLKIIGRDDSVMMEVPGRILWTRNREGEKGTTLGLELLGPLPLPVRQMLEANMAISSKDMKGLWDYWDEIKETATPPVLSRPASPVPVALDNGKASREPMPLSARTQWLYWAGFGAIFSGFIMQFPQSEYLGLSGLAAIFSGSLLVALKSILSMMQKYHPDPFDQGGPEYLRERRTTGREQEPDSGI